MTAPADIRLTADEAYALLLDRVGAEALAGAVEALLYAECFATASASALLRWIAERIAAPQEGR